MSCPVGRLAPSPSGAMHLGNAFSALLAWLSARSQGGQVLLRLEDLDKPRCPRRYGEALMDDLRWLGLDWDNDPLWQSGRDAFYEGCLDRLRAKSLLYPCYCSRKELHAAPTEASAPHGGPVLYSGKCKTLTDIERQVLEAAGRRPSLRVSVPDASYTVHDGHLGDFTARLDRHCGDFILKRSDGLYAYQLAVVADDGAMGVTQIVRGRDLLPSTPQQLWLQDVLGLPHPAYYHVPLLVAPDGRRLSKREGDLSLQALSHRQGPRETVGLLAFWAGLLDKPTPITPQELTPLFHWSLVTKTDIPIHDL